MKKLLILMSILILILIVIYTYIFNNPFVEIKLVGNEIVQLEVNTDYEESGFNAYIYNNNLNDKVIVDTNLNTKKLGSYQLNYKITFFKTTKEVKRKVIVQDTTKPKILLMGNNEIMLEVGTEYKEIGYKAIDNYDGNITDLVEIDSNVNYNIPGKYQIIYKVADTSNNIMTAVRNIIINPKENESEFSVHENNVISNNGYNDIIMGPTYINDILIVNKKYALPKDYGSGIDSEALESLHQLQSAATAVGIDLPVLSAYRSYDVQTQLYSKYYEVDGDKADSYSARPGHSEHQTGLAFDVGSIDDNYGETASGIWLKNNCFLYGFIIRYPIGKEYITGYKYEPWHIRYLGVDIATNIMQRNITLEEYLGI